MRRIQTLLLLALIALMVPMPSAVGQVADSDVTPVLLSPVGCISIATLPAVFVFRNSNRTGPAGSVAYTLQVSKNDTFTSMAGEATVGELPAFRSVCAPGCCLRRDGEPSGVPALCSTDLYS